MWTAVLNFTSFTIKEFNVVGHFMILAFAKKYNQLIIYVLFPNLFLSQERQIKKRKVIRPGLEPRTFRFQSQVRYILSYTATRPRLFHFLTLLFKSSSSVYW